MSTQFGTFPSRRLRRLRSMDFSRRLVRESSLSCSDLILPVFILDRKQGREPISSMPGVERVGFAELVEIAKKAQSLGIPALALFPVIESKKKTMDASEAYNQDGLCLLYTSPSPRD